MRLARRAEVSLDAKVQFDVLAAEPAAAAPRQRRRLLDLREPEHTRVKRTGGILGAGRAGQQYVVNHRRALPEICLDIKIISYGERARRIQSARPARVTELAGYLAMITTAVRAVRLAR